MCEAELEVAGGGSVGQTIWILGSLWCSYTYLLTFYDIWILSQKEKYLTRNFMLLSNTVNPLKRSGVRWLHFKVFSAIQV